MPTLFWLGWLLWGASEAWISVRTRARSAGVRHDAGSKAVIILAILAAILLGSQVAARVAAARMPGPWSTAAAIGFAIVVAGIAYRLWAVETLGRQFRTAVTLFDDHRLIEAGPYRRTRHPSYAGALVTCAGFGASLHNWLALLVLIALPFAAFRYRIAVEERALAGHFGPSWEAYRARTGALLPRLR